MIAGLNSIVYNSDEMTSGGGHLYYTASGSHIVSYWDDLGEAIKKIKNMTLNELGSKLNEMYTNAPKGDSVAMIHLFGIKYANVIKEGNYSKKDIITQSGISTSYLQNCQRV